MYNILTDVIIPWICIIAAVYLFIRGLIMNNHLGVLLKIAAAVMYIFIVVSAVNYLLVALADYFNPLIR
jgi:hypothetical protein